MVSGFSPRISARNGKRRLERLTAAMGQNSRFLELFYFGLIFLLVFLKIWAVEFSYGSG
jgi:hypothetical protein